MGPHTQKLSKLIFYLSEYGGKLLSHSPMTPYLLVFLSCVTLSFDCVWDLWWASKERNTERNQLPCYTLPKEGPRWQGLDASGQQSAKAYGQPVARWVITEADCLQASPQMRPQAWPAAGFQHHEVPEPKNIGLITDSSLPTETVWHKCCFKPLSVLFGNR